MEVTAGKKKRREIAHSDETLHLETGTKNELSFSAVFSCKVKIKKTRYKSIKSPGSGRCTAMPLRTTSVINHVAMLSRCTCPPASGDELCCPAASMYMSAQQETALDWTPLII